jgi:hypothetical protein
VRDEPCELFLDTSAWGSGVAWVNGHDIGVPADLTARFSV